MKKFFTILSLMLGSVTMLVAAPSPDENEAERVSAARDIVSIKPNEDKSGLSLSIAGFELGISNHDQAGKTSGQKKAAEKKPYRNKIAVFELGFSQMRDVDYSDYPTRTSDFMDMTPGRSIQFGLNLFTAGYGFDRYGIAGLSTGLGLYWNNYVFSDKTTCIGEETGRIAPYAIGGDPQKSKMRNFGFRVPLTLDINMGEIFVSAGGFGEWDLRSYTKTAPPKQYTDLKYTDPLQYGLLGKIGYDGICVYCNYYLSNMFKPDKGPQGSVLTIGLGIGL